MKYFSKVFLAVPIAILVLSTLSSTDAAIGIYKTPQQIPGVPAPVSYMLNTDANNASGDWSVKIEIIPKLGGAPVRTYKFLYPAPETLKGMHSNAVVWNGYKDDGNPAPFGDYKAVISAKAAPVTGTNLVPLWESTDISTNAWRDIAINRDPYSPRYGCVYATNSGLKNIYIYEPDGSTYAVFTAKSTNNWSGSAPWGIDIAGDNNAWITSYSQSLLGKFNPDGSLRLWEGQPMDSAYKNPRFMSVDGSGTNWKAAETVWTLGQPTSMKLLTYNGPEPPSSLFTETAVDWPLTEPKFDSDGNIAVCAYSGHNSTIGGAIAKYDVNGSLLAENPNIHRGVGLAYSPDGYFIWVSRYVDNTSNDYTDPDTTAIYKIAASSAFTTANPGTRAGVDKLGINCAGVSKRAYTIDCDPFGNIVAVTGISNGLVAPYCTHIGVYAPPDNGSVAVKEIPITPFPCNPRIIDCSITPNRVCNDEVTTVTVTAVVEDCDGDMASCKLMWPEGGYPSGVPMNLWSHSGTQYTYKLTLTIPAGMSIGTHTMTVCAYDAQYPFHPSDCFEAEFEVYAPCCLGCTKLQPTGEITVYCPDNPMVVTYVDTPPSGQSRKWFFVETSDRSAAIKVNAENVNLPAIWPGDTIARMRGWTSTDARGSKITLTAAPEIIPGTISNIPKPLGVSNLHIGGGAFGCSPAVTDRGVGLNTDGLLVTVSGKVREINYYGASQPEEVIIDDGSMVSNGSLDRGLKCYTGGSPSPGNLSVGDYVVIDGIASGETGILTVYNDGSSAPVEYILRLRTLQMRYCPDPIKGDICDSIRIVVDAP